MGKIPEDRLKKICKIGTPDTCRFIACGPNGFTCEKHGDLAELINERARTKQMRARGDHCDGV